MIELLKNFNLDIEPKNIIYLFIVYKILKELKVFNNDTNFDPMNLINQIHRPMPQIIHRSPPKSNFSGLFLISIIIFSLIYAFKNIVNISLLEFDIECPYKKSHSFLKTKTCSV